MKSGIAYAADSLAQRTTPLAFPSSVLPLACRRVLAMECGRGVNPYPKIKVLLCELILMFFVRKDWIDASLKESSSESESFHFPEGVQNEKPDHYLILHPASSDTTWEKTTLQVDAKPEDKPCAQICNQRVLLSRRHGGHNKGQIQQYAEKEGDLASFMMMSKRTGRGDGNKDKEKKVDRPRRQKQPNGHSFRRRAPLRRRTVRQRLAERQVMYPNRSHSYPQQAALDREVRGIFTRRPDDAHGTGLSGPELVHLEAMLRGDGAWCQACYRQ